MPDLRLLVKMRPAAAATLQMAGAKLRFSTRPLFTSIEGRGLGATGTARWHVLTPVAETGGAGTSEIANPWDLCHQLAGTAGVGLAGGTQIEFAEPDLQQRWIVGRPGSVATALAAAPAGPDPQNPSYPFLPNNFWYRDPKHAQWDAALAASPDPGDAGRTRIAHLDTGYDPHHATLPQHLNRTLQKNFVDADRPGDASDDSSGLINNLGHGTGTLSILAGAGIAGVNGGKPFGCAPTAEVVPVRVANSVVLFWNSAIAQAFDYVHDLCRNPSTFVHVITMSMGGLPSRAWADAVNALYDAGVFIVTAAGNNFANLPTAQIVYPARFGRVVAACGVMADQKPYADLAPSLIAGNYGPSSKMKTAMAAYTPNTPWARFGAPGIVDYDGNGTSAATPQVAAAAALWIQKNRAAYDKYPQPWMRVEALRKALFDGAHADPDMLHFGRGRLAAQDALGEKPARADDLRAAKMPPDAVSFPILNLLGAPALAAAPAGTRAMLELEALQVAQSSQLETPLPDPGAAQPDMHAAARLADELLAKPGLSKALRAALEAGARPVSVPVGTARATGKSAHTRSDWQHLQAALAPKRRPPAARRLRVYAYDPALATDLENYGINEATIAVDWEEDLQPGPVGEYIEVVDVDPASGSCYAPVDLNDPFVIAEDGLAPSEANPQFHQQMCYAVAMRTIEHFERALGRKALWSSRYVRDAKGTVIDESYVRRLRIYPHALRAENSFYHPDRKALLLGYFRAGAAETGTTLPNSRVFCAVSHDVIAHETTHALLDGLHRRYQEATNPDVLAFHEAFADIVALLQHFSLPEALSAQIRQTRGDLEQKSLLAKLAIQFGQATRSRYGALRDALGDKPTAQDYERSIEPHARGAVLVAAVFAAFVSIYQRRAADLIRLATDGTGVLRAGAISDDLARRLTDEASKVASHVLGICIRALDYCPPVDITFGEYLRALITADYDVVRDDIHGYRVAFISAFRDRGIFPAGVRHLAVDSLLWEPPTVPYDRMQEIMGQLDVSWNLYGDRQLAYKTSKRNAAFFHQWLVDPKRRDFVAALGFLQAQQTAQIAGMSGEIRPVEVHSVRPARRVGPDGQTSSDVVVELTQTFRPEQDPRHRYRGGCTLLVDLQSFKPRYHISKTLQGAGGVAGQQAFRMAQGSDGAWWANFYPAAPGSANPFALLHGRH